MTISRTEWFSHDRFGIFIHWGLYSIPAGVWEGRTMGRNGYAEWIQMQARWPRGIPGKEYRQLARRFTPASFDADRWMAEVRRAGARYVVITAKHHDGFALWPSHVSKFNVVEATPFKRDILGELAKACQRHGLKLGLYYSHWQDWEHPGGARPPWPEVPGDPKIRQPSSSAFDHYWTEKCLPQVRELIADYDPALLWFDSWGPTKQLTPERLDRLIAQVRRDSPACLINSRIGVTWNHPKGNALVDYLSTADNEFPSERIRRPWETSATMNNSWGYHKRDHEWKSPRQLLRHLVDNVSRNGNMQLNVGPTANGRFPAPAIRRLREIGAWLASNGEAIYGADVCGLPEPPWGRLTQRRMPEGHTRIYAHIYQWNAGVPLPIAGVRNAPLRACVLETGQRVPVRAKGSTLFLALPSACPDERVAVIAVDVAGGMRRAAGPSSARPPAPRFESRKQV